jgi:peptide/nickel transport system substrate-binding protein
MNESLRFFTRGRRSALVTILLVLLCACGTQADSRPSSSAPGSGPAPAGQPQARKVVTIGIQREPGGFLGLAPDLGIGGGAKNAEMLPHERLVVLNDRGDYQPQLAVEQIAVEKGTWKVNPDGSMDVTWRIHPNVVWHDGTPFTTEDMVFAFNARRDPEIGARIPGRPDLIESVSTPDAHTMVVHWSALYVNADRAEGFEPAPRHLLESLYKSDKAGLANSPYLTTQFVGLGAYRLARWDRGSHMEFAPFEGHYRGRPRLDGVVVRFLGDPNTMAANILSGTVDILLPEGVGLDSALEIRRRWEGTGNEVRFDFEGDLEMIDSQHRREAARPANGLTNRVVREAFYRAIDRQALTEAINEGFAPVADSWFSPTDARRAEVESAIPQYPYDLARAQQLLASVGWVRGSDGVLTHNETGERFISEIRSGQGSEQELGVLSNFWKVLGAQIEIAVIPSARQGDREYAANFPGMLIESPPANRFYEDRYHTRRLASAETRWTGTNRSGYLNAAVDTLTDRLSVTIDARQRIPVHRELLQAFLGDVAIMPLYWEVAPVLSLKGIKAVRIADSTATWDMLAWDRE